MTKFQIQVGEGSLHIVEASTKFLAKKKLKGQGYSPPMMVVSIITDEASNVTKEQWNAAASDETLPKDVS